MSRSRRLPKPQIDPLGEWLALDWDRPERSYNPDVRDFLAGLLDYPKDRVVTEDTGGGGYPDIKLLTPEKIAWVVGDLKKDDAEPPTIHVYNLNSLLRDADDEIDTCWSSRGFLPRNFLPPHS